MFNVYFFFLRESGLFVHAVQHLARPVCVAGNNESHTGLGLVKQEQ